MRSGGEMARALQLERGTRKQPRMRISAQSATIRRSIQVHVRTPDDAATVRERIEPYLEAGIDHICIGLPLVYQEDLVARIAAGGPAADAARAATREATKTPRPAGDPSRRGAAA